MTSHLKSALRDIEKSWKLRAIWLFLAWEDCSKQYRRTFLGPIWITLNTAIFIFSFAFIWSQLFGHNLSDYLPYVATGHIIYSLLNSLVIEGCSVFMANEAYLKQVPVPKFGFVIRLIVKNLILFAHNVLIIVVVFVWYGRAIDFSALLSVAALFLALLNAVFLVTMLGFLCARFRDIPMVVGNVMQILFFVTPVLWKTTQLPRDSMLLVNLNPMAVFVQLIRDPLLGVLPNAYLWTYGLIFTLVNFLLFCFVFSTYRSRLIYWL
jgi:lipopolysaccharide transport system permease protein